MTEPPFERLLSRLLPSRLAARLVLTTTLAAIAVFALLSVIIIAAISYHLRSMATESAVRDLTGAAAAIEMNARELDSYVVTFAQWHEFYDRTREPDALFAAAELDPWLPDRTGADTIAWWREDGTLIHSRGDARDIEAIRSLAAAGEVAGAALLPSGPSVVAVRRVVGDPPRPAAGWLAVARPLTDENLPVALHAIDSSSLPDTENGWRTIGVPAGYTEAMVRTRSGTLTARATVRGIDGNPVAVAEVTQPDPWLGEGRGWIVVLVPAALGVFTVAVGLGLGVFVSRNIARPLAAFVRYMQDQGYFALQGLRTDEELRVDPRLPDDFKDLGAVIVDLMTQLRVNQAELIEAGEQALAAERAFRTVVEESPEVKILVRDGVVEIANPAAAHFFGLHLGDLVRADPNRIFAGVDLFDEDGDALDLATIRKRASTQPVIARCVAADQPDRWIEITVAALGESETDHVISARNITEERRLEALREEIWSLVSHDLRSPLTAVRGYLDILDRQPPPDTSAEAVRGARYAAQRMETLLEDLLNATRAERAFAPSVMRTVDLGEVAERSVEALRVSTDRDIRLDAAADVFVLGDEVRLEQAVANLVGNAIKHGGTEGPIDVAVCAHDGRARLTVRDRGPGVSPEIAERIFERGVRGASADGLPGLGLGLYIVRIVAEAHGGSVGVEPHEGPGAWFVLELPLEQLPED